MKVPKAVPLTALTVLLIVAVFASIANTPEPALRLPVLDISPAAGSNATATLAPPKVGADWPLSAIPDPPHDTWPPVVLPASRRLIVPPPAALGVLSPAEAKLAQGRRRFPDDGVERCMPGVGLDTAAHVAAVKACGKRAWPTPLPEPEPRCPRGPAEGVQCEAMVAAPAWLPKKLGCGNVTLQLCQVDDVSTLPPENILMWEPEPDMILPVNARPKGGVTPAKYGGVTASYIVRLQNAVVDMNLKTGMFVMNSRFFLTHGFENSGLTRYGGGVDAPPHDRILVLAQKYSSCVCGAVVGWKAASSLSHRVFSHMSFEAIPRANMVTRFLLDNPDVVVYVESELSQSMLRRAWEPLGMGGRVLYAPRSFKAKELYFPHYHHGPGRRKTQFGLMPRHSYNIVGPLLRAPLPTKRTIITFLLRGNDRRRGMDPTNEAAMLAAVRKSLAPRFRVVVVRDPDNWLDLRETLAATVVVVAVHGGQLGNLFLLHPGAHVVEVLDETYSGATMGLDGNYWKLQPTFFVPASGKAVYPFYDGSHVHVDVETLVGVLSEIGVTKGAAKPLASV